MTSSRIRFNLVLDCIKFVIRETLLRLVSITHSYIPVMLGAAAVFMGNTFLVTFEVTSAKQ